MMRTSQRPHLHIHSLMLVAIQAFVIASCGGQARAPEPPPSSEISDIAGYAEINSVKLYYRIVGEGEPLLLLHGGLSGSEYFDAIVPTLAKSFKVITVDRRGHGRSYDNAEPYTYATMADEMNAFLDHIQIDSAMMLGFSDGGVVGYHLASTYPVRVKKLVAVGANYRVGGMTDPTQDWARNQLTPESLRAAMPGIADRYMAENPQPENYSSWVERSRELWLRDPYLTESQMSEIQTEVLFVAGEKDAIRIDHVLEMHALVSNAQVCILPNATHFVLSEKPDMVLPILMDFFEN